MFTTDMGSLAHDRIHDLLTARTATMALLDASQAKDQPSPVRETHPALEEASYTMLETIEDEIIAWLNAVIYQERGVHDIKHIDRLLGGILSSIGGSGGYLKRAWAEVYPKRAWPESED